jgi:hypothetical protein
MHPFAVAPRGDDAGAAQIGQMARDFRLRQVLRFDQITDADLVTVHKVEQPPPRAVGQSAEKQLQRKGLVGPGSRGRFCRHSFYICLDIYIVNLIFV